MATKGVSTSYYFGFANSTYNKLNSTNSTNPYKITSAIYSNTIPEETTTIIRKYFSANGNNNKIPFLTGQPGEINLPLALGLGIGLSLGVLLFVCVASAIYCIIRSKRRRAEKEARHFHNDRVAKEFRKIIAEWSSSETTTTATERKNDEQYENPVTFGNGIFRPVTANESRTNPNETDVPTSSGSATESRAENTAAGNTAGNTAKNTEENKAENTAKHTAENKAGNTAAKNTAENTAENMVKNTAKNKEENKAGNTAAKNTADSTAAAGISREKKKIVNLNENKNKNYKNNNPDEIKPDIFNNNDRDSQLGGISYIAYSGGEYNLMRQMMMMADEIPDSEKNNNVRTTTTAGNRSRDLTKMSNDGKKFIDYNNNNNGNNDDISNNNEDGRKFVDTGIM